MRAGVAVRGRDGLSRPADWADIYGRIRRMVAQRRRDRRAIPD